MLEIKFYVMLKPHPVILFIFIPDVTEDLLQESPRLLIIVKVEHWYDPDCTPLFFLLSACPACYLSISASSNYALTAALASQSLGGNDVDCLISDWCDSSCPYLLPVTSSLPLSVLYRCYDKCYLNHHHQHKHLSWMWMWMNSEMDIFIFGPYFLIKLSAFVRE